MKLHELFEKDDNGIKSKDPKVIHTIKQARAKYHGIAGDDLSALVSMMGDEQKDQDHEIDSLDSYNMDQDVEIDDTERVNNDQELELNDLRDRINKMQRGPVSEENDTRSQDDWVELVVLTGSQNEEQLMQAVMSGDDTALHMHLKDIAHEVGVPEHMRNSVAYQAANRIPVPDSNMSETVSQTIWNQTSLSRDLVAYPNIAFDRNQAIKIPSGTEVDIAPGGDFHKQNLIKLVANNKLYYTTQQNYYAALSANVKEEIVPHKSDYSGDIKWIDDETGEMFTDKERQEMTNPTPKSKTIAPDEVVAIWKEIFPNTSVRASKAFGGGYAFKFHLAKDRTEVSSGIMDNDPLNYVAFIDPDGSWHESHTYMHVAPPEGSHLVYGSEKFRKKKAKQVTPDMLRKRFNVVKDFVVSHANKLKDPGFDISTKIS